MGMVLKRHRELIHDPKTDGFNEPKNCNPVESCSYIHCVLFLKIITLSRYTIFSIIAITPNNFETPILVKLCIFHMTRRLVHDGS